MVLRPEPVAAALDELRRPDSVAILLDPAGEVFRQARAADLADADALVLVCPRYEGVDERIRALVDLELSIGDYVLTGGELPALVVIDAVTAAAAGRHRRRVDGRGVVQRRPARVPAVHAPADVPGHGRARDPRPRATTAPSAAGARAGARADAERRPDLLDRPAPTASRLSGSTTGPDSCGERAILRALGRSSTTVPTPIPQPRAAPTRPRNRRVNVLDEIVQDQLRTDLPELASGDTVKVSAKVVEGNRERIQVFEGTVMRLRGGGITRSITVRRIARGVGVERTFKVNSPRIEKIEVVRHGQVARRAQLYFLRKRVGKAATLRERRPSWPGRPGHRADHDPADRRGRFASGALR